MHIYTAEYDDGKFKPRYLLEIKYEYKKVIII